MKNRRKLLCLITTFILMGSIMISQKVCAAGVPWYKTVMQTKKQQGLRYYKLLDINRDGRKELLLSTTDNFFITYEDKVEIWSRIKGRNRHIKNILGTPGGGCLLYSKKDRTLIHSTRGSGEEHRKFYKLKKGKLKKVKTSDYYGSYHDPKTGNNKKPVYYINGKKVSSKRGERLYNKKMSTLYYKAIQ